MIFVTGDLHGSENFMRIYGFRDKRREIPLTKNDYLVILGDFGLVWANDPTKPSKHEIKDEKLLDRLSSFPWTTLIVDGNHDNIPRLLSYPEVPMFGDSVGKIRDSIFHLKRGRVYNIDGQKVFTCGGGLSIDKASRIVGVSWWAEELPSYAEIELALTNLEKHNNTVDLVFSHEAPRHLVHRILGNDVTDADFKYKSSLAEFFEHLYKDVLKFKKWYCGHYHVETKVENVQCLYKSIIKLEV